MQRLPVDEKWLAGTLSSGYTLEEIPVLFCCTKEELTQIHNRLQESMMGNRANDHKVNELRFSNNFVEKRSSSFLKALRNQDILLTEWWSMNQPNRVNYKFHDFFKSGS